MTGNPLVCVSRGNLHWPRGNIFTKVNVMKMRNLFVASIGRVNNSMRRNDFSLRRKTTTAQQDPERLIDKLILHACSLSIKYK